ncbi:MAG: ATP-dependent RecD-like DNA helicase [bacterium]|nr:ATP-dependent RecD-like DNA helicase [bacterium]
MADAKKDVKKVKVLKKIFFSEETGYGVFNVSIKGSREQAVIVGNLFDVGKGDFLEVTGEEVDHPAYGTQFRVQTYKSLPPGDKDGIIKYLSSGRFAGVRKRTAEKIVEKFGNKTFEILRDQPERLREIKGLRKNLVEEIKKNTKDNKTIRELTVKLGPYGIGNETIFKVYKEFGDDAFGILEQNAYMLIDRVRGVGFRIADTIAMGFGVPRNDTARIKAGIVFLVTQYEQQNGDLYVEEPGLIARCTALLDVKSEEVAENIDTLVERNELVREEIPGKVILNYKNFAIEKMIAQRLFKLAQPDNPLPPVAVDFDYIAGKTSVELTGEQQEAVVSSAGNRITIITGGPGTGKTTIIRAIIEAFQKAEKNVLVAAPTGRAAKRIEEASFYSASTIHRMLQIDPETGRFVHDEHNPLKADVVIVDEFSMVDSFIFHSLLKAIARHTRLIIIGDKDQLPSVGPGNVLRDIITCGFFDIIYLNRNFRQTKDSLIIENAYRINGGEPLIFKKYAEDLDFVFIKVPNETRALEKVLGILEYYKETYAFNSQDMQVLVPMYRGAAGIDSLNTRIQEQFNRQPFIIKKEKAAFKQWDRVMQLKNNYEKMVFNGEQGIISKFDPEKKKLKVDFDGNLVEYHVSELEELTLSYAVSVHKAQGSEYDMLVLVLLPSHSIMLNRELFYTAVTRAKKKILLISDEITVQRAVSNASPSERKTLLPRRLDEVFTGGAGN